MSTAYSSANQKYIGNGVTTEWGFDFPIQKHSELKVYLKRSGLSQVLLEEGVDYSFVTENTIAFPIKTGEAKLQAADVLALQRESVFESEYNFSNQQRLEPEEVMHADDNLERQIQELKRDVTQAIRIQPTSNINTDEYFIAVESIYENLDNITNVSGISAEIVNCSDNISDISTVSSNIANVNAVGQSISSVNTVASNVSSVNTVAGVSTDVTAVAGISTDVSTVANNSANVTTVATNISDVNTTATNIEAIKAATTAATNAAQSATNAANSATDSANSSTASATSANNSHIWAEGTDAQVQALGGVHSSKVWAEQSTNANIALTNSPYTTNRILEIPQDIKLELNNGTLTLKAGSKVYALDGSSYTIPSDKTLDYYNSEPHSSWILVKENGEMDDIWTSEGVSSISIGSKWVTFRETNYYLPICVATHNADGTNRNGWKSIDQVFNGFGYIGSTVFVLPGVKVQIPNGRNADGTCRSVYGAIRTVQQTSINPGNGDFSIRIGDNYIAVSKFVCDAETNYNYNHTVSPSNIRYQTHAGTVSYLSGRITSLKPYTVDSVVNSNLSNLSAAGQNVIQNIADKSGNPTGTIIVWSTSTPPEGYLVCDGSAISRTTYARLFQVIGTTWGAGDGNTTFNVPNFNGAKIIRGNNIPVYGTGKGLRLTANSSIGGYMFQHVFDSGAGEFDTSIYVTNYASDANVGTAQSGGLLPNNVVLGVPPKTAGNFDSGLQADLSGSNNVVYCIRY